MSRRRPPAAVHPRRRDRAGPERELTIERIVAGGEGLAHREGKAVFVAAALPAERVLVRLSESHRDYERAELLEVLEPSAHRTIPACPLAGTCGGCDWLHVAPGRQPELKRGIVEEALRRTGGMVEPPSVDAGVPGPSLAYRNRVQLHRAGDGRLGFRGARSDRVLPTAACPVAAAPINGLLAEPSRGPTGLDRFVALGDADWLACEGRDDERELAVDVAGRAIRFSVGCFFQSNLAVLQDLVRHVAEAAGGGSAMADLYAGVGLFSALLAERFGRVVDVESGTRNLSFARRNVSGTSLECFPLTVEQWVAAGAPGGPFDLVIVDPPRAGLAPEVRAWLARSRPRRLVYVSCGPVTLARDLGALARSGYSIESVRLFDCYPQTSHVEAVAVCTTLPVQAGT